MVSPEYCLGPTSFYYLLFPINTDLIIELCGQPVNGVIQETYFGNYIGANIYDRSITKSVCSLNSKSNHVIADSSMLGSFSLQR